MAERHFVKYTFLQIDPAWRRLRRVRAGRAQARVPRRVRGLRRPTICCSRFRLVGTRGDAELMLVAEAENLDRIHEFHVVLAQSGPDEVGDAAVLVPRACARRRSTPTRSACPAPLPRQVPVRLPVRQDARLVRAAGRGALADHAGAHQGRPRVPEGRQPHDLLLRPRRPGVRRRVRHRRRRRVPRPRPAPAHDRGLGLHAARHAVVHLHRHVAGARAQRARRRGARPVAAPYGERPPPQHLRARRPGARPPARRGRAAARARSPTGDPYARARARDRRPAAVGHARRARSTARLLERFGGRAPTPRRDPGRRSRGAAHARRPVARQDRLPASLAEHVEAASSSSTGSASSTTRS